MPEATLAQRRLKLPPRDRLRHSRHHDPVRFYYWPVLGQLYRRRVELCLSELRGGHRILEVGYGSGVSFLNLHELYGEIHGLDLDSPPDDVVAAFAEFSIRPQLRRGNVLEMPYENEQFDAVLLISILEHLKPDELPRAFQEIQRVLRPGGQVVFGVPVERPMMVLMFRLLGYNIREHHFSTERQVAEAARRVFLKGQVAVMRTLLGPVYHVGHFVKETAGSP